jgi:transcriptional regulator with XRE-family HTH domain
MECGHFKRNPLIMKTIFAGKLKKLREKKWLSRSELAERSSVCYRSIKYYEAGRIVPSPASFTRLILGLGASEEEALDLRVAWMESKLPGSTMLNVRYGLNGNVKSGCIP